MTDYIETVTLGIVQGLTEFFPVSSSGHLVLVQHLFGIKEGALLLDVMLHVASALAVVCVLRKDIENLVRGSVSGNRQARNSAWRYIGYLFVGSIPAGIAGIAFKDFFEGLFSNPGAVGIMLLITAALLFCTLLRKQEGSGLSLVQAIIIGCAQAIAICPGISRSGSTIAVALIIGVSRRDAGTFSFLLALPAILGAALLHVKDLGSDDLVWAPVIAGFAASLVVSIIALKLLLWFIRDGRLHYFGYYCAILGIATLVFVR
ncbi:MAG: undecaprenyl-diphosphate phosphatase [Chitinispirillaceae bacterium]|nr:undecaprenyl-diphosphate phosphatase [Chitinispirillaceae bacterium]